MLYGFLFLAKLAIFLRIVNCSMVFVRQLFPLFSMDDELRLDKQVIVSCFSYSLTTLA